MKVLQLTQQSYQAALIQPNFSLVKHFYIKNTTSGRQFASEIIRLHLRQLQFSTRRCDVLSTKNNLAICSWSLQKKSNFKLTKNHNKRPPNATLMSKHTLQMYTFAAPVHETLVYSLCILCIYYVIWYTICTEVLLNSSSQHWLCCI